MSWSLSDLWNQSVFSRQRPLVARDYLYASEIGSSNIEVYLKMRAVEPSNPPNLRSLRKFEMGNLIEWIVKYVLERAGIIVQTQNRIHVDYPNMLSVHGKLDFLAGGRIDVQKAREAVESLDNVLGFPEGIAASSMCIVEKLYEKFGDIVLKMIVLEIKSCSAAVADMMERTNKPLRHHIMQCFHYLKGMDMDEGHIVYVCKDDARMFEFPVWNDSQTERTYVSDLMAKTKYHNEGVMPPKEPLIILENGKFKKNFYVEYSSYLTMVYGFESPREYSESVSPQVLRWNRVIARYATDQKITAKNEEVRAEIMKEGWSFDLIIAEAKAMGVKVEEDAE